MQNPHSNAIVEVRLFKGSDGEWFVGGMKNQQTVMRTDISVDPAALSISAVVKCSVRFDSAHGILYKFSSEYLLPFGDYGNTSIDR